MDLRPYQSDIMDAILTAWVAGSRNVLAVLPTGAGKTFLFSRIIREHSGAVCAIAHRQELVSQISLALARDEVYHKIIGPKDVVRMVVGLQMEELGSSYYCPNANVAVAGIDTLVRRDLSSWAKQVTLWVQDEAHHVLRKNKWGSAVEMFPNARGLGVTATPERADGNGLGRSAEGVFDTLLVGAGMRELIRLEYLTDYRIFAPPTDIDLGSVNVSSRTGDYAQPGLRTAVRKSRIVGDVVAHYRKLAPGALGVTFATDVEVASDIARKFTEAGVPAEVVTAKTPTRERINTLRRFRNREILQLVNVDIFGEGFDLPAIEVVSMARPTQSYGLYVQQFGRGLRPMPGKTHALIIDHVGNVMRHGLPDASRGWTLNSRDRRARSAPSDAIPVRTCLECFAVYERIRVTCPNCGARHVPGNRSKPEFVDGDLFELSPEALAALRGERDQVDMPAEQYRAQLVARGCPTIGQAANVKRHVARQDAQRMLREQIAWWAGHQRHRGRSDSESYRRFYHMFGVDVLSAQALGAAAAGDLTERIARDLETRKDSA